MKLGPVAKLGSTAALAFSLFTSASPVIGRADRQRLEVSEQAVPAWRHYPAPPVAPAGAPNILIVMTDDVGFGSASTFGGLIPTPNLDQLAIEGLRYTQFHTTAMCSPTRAALLTGRNHHDVNSGAIGNMSIDREGYTSVIPKSAATFGKVLGMNGYQTAWFGKNHNTPLWEDTRSGPFDRWPTGMGFDYFYGFNGSQTDQFRPSLVENRNRIAAPDDPGYILEKDLADHAIGWLRQQDSQESGRPFLLYYAPGTAHAPLQAPAEWRARFRGKFDMGWDAMREEICARQLAEKIVPPGTECTPRPAEIPAWSSLTEKEQRFSARLMETFAAMLAYSDYQFGRILDELKSSGRYDNTLIVFIEGDNGASAESLFGEFNEVAMFNQVDTRAEDLDRFEQVGSRDSTPVNASGWAWAMNAPFQWSKQIASHFGGTRNGMVISWPERIRARGEIRTGFHHVIDIAPTLYEAVGITPAPVIEGLKQQPLAGVSMVPSFLVSQSDQRTQYFEMLGNRALYKNGWIASTTPRRMPWSGEYLRPGYAWELYDVSADFSQGKNLAKQYPERLAKLRAEFDSVAKAHHVLPIDDSFLSRFSPKLRPSLFSASNHYVFYPSNIPYSPTGFPTLNSNWKVTARIDLSSANASGPVVVRGDEFSGWGVFLDQGRVRLVYRVTHLDRQAYEIASAAPLPEGKHEIAVSVVPNGDGSQLLDLSIDGVSSGTQALKQLAFGRVETGIGRQTDIPLIPMRAGPATGLEIEQVGVQLGVK